MGGLGDIWVTIGADTRALKKGLKEVGKMSAAAFAAMSAGLAATAKVGADFERTIANAAAKATQGGAGFNAAYASMEASAMRVAKATEFTAKEVGEGMEFMAQAGMSAEQAISSIGPAAKLATVGSMDLGRAADIVTNTMTGFRIGFEDIDHVMDVFATAATSANVTIESIGQSMSFIAATAKGAGMSIEETAGWIAKLGAAGLKGERGGTAIRGAMRAMIGPTDLVKKRIQEVGVSFETVPGKVRPMTAVLDDLKAKGVTAGQIMRIFGSEAGPGVSAMMGIGADALREMVVSLEKSSEAGGSANRIFERMSKTVSFQFGSMKSSAEGAVLAFYKELKPAIETVVGAIKMMLDWLARLSPEVKGIIAAVTTAAFAVTGLGAAAAGVGVALGALGSVISVAFTAIAAAAGLVVSAIGGLAAAIGVGVAPVAIVVATVAAAVGAAVYAMVYHWEWFVETLGGVADAAVAAVMFLVKPYQPLIDATQKTVEWLSELWGDLKEALSDFAAYMKSEFAADVDSGLGSLTGFFDDTVQSISSAIDEIVAKVRDLIPGIAEALSKGLSTLAGAARGSDLMQRLMGPEMITGAEDAAKAMVDAFASEADVVAAEAGEVAKKVTKAAGEGAAAGAEAAAGVTKSVVRETIEVGKVAITSVSELGESASDIVGSVIEKTKSMATDTADVVGQKIDELQGLLAKARGAAKGSADALGSTGATGTASGSSLASREAEAVGRPGGDDVKGVVSGSVDTMLGGAGALGGTVSAGMQGFAMGGPIGAIVAVIADVIMQLESFMDSIDVANEGFGVLLDSIDPLFEGFSEVNQIANEGLIPIFEALGPIMRMVGKIFSSIGKVVSTVISAFVKAFMDVFDTLMPIFDWFAQALDDVTNAILDILGPALDWLADAFADVARVFEDVLWELGSFINTITFGSGAGDFLMEPRRVREADESLGSFVGALDEASYRVAESSGSLGAAKDKVGNLFDRIGDSLDLDAMWKRAFDKRSGNLDSFASAMADSGMALDEMRRKILDFGASVGVTNSNQHFADWLEKFLESTEMSRMTDAAIEAALGLEGVSEATREVSESLTNVPAGLKLALARYNAATGATPESIGLPAASATTGAMAPVVNNFNAPISVSADGNADAIGAELMQAARDRSYAEFGSTEPA